MTDDPKKCDNCGTSPERDFLCPCGCGIRVCGGCARTVADNLAKARR